MLGRRQIREKVMQSLYSLERGNESPIKVKNQMQKGIDEIYDLYIYLLNLLVALHQIAEKKIEIGKSKKLATEVDLNPNLKFVNNPILTLLNSNLERTSYTEKNKQLQWDLLDSLPNNLFKELTQSNLYQDYMNSDQDDFNFHKEFTLSLYETLAEKENLWLWLEDLKLHWSSDQQIANTMVYNTIKSLIPKSDENIRLFKTYKNQDDEEFAENLFDLSIEHKEETGKRIKELANNWEVNRIAKIDFILLQMAITELFYFPSIPPKVTMNEYIELAKDFSTEKSKIFINGILDRCLKEIS